MAPTHSLHIKNMVCNRCIRVVREELTNLGLSVQDVVLGRAVIASKRESYDQRAVAQVLAHSGFELLEDSSSQKVEQIKATIIALVQGDKLAELHVNISDYLAGALNHSYSYLSRLFSSVEGGTIERYVILQKIERAKELLVYDQLSLGNIAYRLGYSSIQHLSSQFKRVTGLTATHFRDIGYKRRLPLDQLK